MEETYPSGRVVRNTVDENGELSQVQTKKNAGYGFLKYAGGIHTNAAGMVDRMQLGNGRWETAAYNNRLQVTQMGLGLTPDDQNLLKLEFGYNTTGNNDNNGAMLSQKITVPTEGANTGFTATQTYTYDTLNRLQSATETVSSTQTWKQTFDIDRYGNRRFDTTGTNTTTLGSSFSASAVNPTINTSDNRLSSGQGYSYDANGNLTQDNNNTAVPNYVYDAESRQIAVQNSSLVDKGRYDYDGEGRRIRKTSDAETTVFVYDGAGQLAAEYSTTLATTPQVSYSTADHLGSPRIVTNQTGDITSRKDFNAYGEETFTSQRTTGLHYLLANQPREVRQDYTGYQKDEESGLEYAQARYYNAGHGRFTSVDPLTASGNIKDPQTFNRYTYALNSPYKFTDPLGLSAVGVYWNNSNPGVGGAGGAFSSAASGFGAGQGLSNDAGLSVALTDSQVSPQASGPVNAASEQVINNSGNNLLPPTLPPPIDSSLEGIPEDQRNGLEIGPDPFSIPLQTSNSNNSDSLPATAITTVTGSNFGVSSSRGVFIQSSENTIVIRDGSGNRLFGDYYNLTEIVTNIYINSDVPEGFWSIPTYDATGKLSPEPFIRTVPVTQGGNAQDRFTLKSPTPFNDGNRLLQRQTLNVTDTRNGNTYTVGHNIIIFSLKGVQIINCNNGCR